MIAGNGADVEVVELLKTNSIPLFGQLPSARYAAVGTMLNNTPILCGGKEDTIIFDTCISYHNDSEWIQSQSMVRKRSTAAGVKVNSTTFWILGGKDYIDDSDVYLDSTEFIIQGQTNGVPGPKLPYVFESICAVKISENEIFVIGIKRNEGYKTEVWIYDPQNGYNRTKGASLKTKRFLLSCSAMKDGEKIMVITAGGLDNNFDNDNRVEIYDSTLKTWNSGKNNQLRTKINQFNIFKLKKLKCMAS